MTVKFSLLRNMRTYSIELRERNYPTFEGRYNAYVGVYGQLSGEYMGCIDDCLKMDVAENEAPILANNAEDFINSHKYSSPVIW